MRVASRKCSSLDRLFIRSHSIRSVIPRSLGPLRPASAVARPLVPLVPSFPASPKSICLHISTTKYNAEKYLQRTPLCNPMKVGFLPPETVEGELISFWTGGLAISAMFCITYS